MLRRTFLTLVVALGISVNAVAQSVAPKEAPEAFVERVSNQIITTIESDKNLQTGNKKAVEAMVDRVMMPNVDFLRMTRMAVGPQWRKATPEQRETLQQLFRETLIAVYSGGMSMALNQEVRVLPNTQKDDTEAVVRTGMRTKNDPSKPEIMMVYRLRNDKGNWKMIDVNVEGVWLVSNYRSQYGNIAAQEGIEGLIRRMQEGINKANQKK